MFLFPWNDSLLVCSCWCGCSWLSTKCILKALWSYEKFSQAVYWSARTIVLELLRIPSMLLCLSFDSTTHTPLSGAPSFCFKLGLIIVNCANFMRVNFPLCLFCSRTNLPNTWANTFYLSVSQNITLIHLDREWGIEEKAARREESYLSLIAALVNETEEMRQMGRRLKSSRIVIIYPKSSV